MVVHKSICFPLFFSCSSELEYFQSKCCFTKFLHDNILIACVEQVVVLKCVVIIQVLSFIKVSNSLVVVFWVYYCVVVCIIDVRIAVYGKLSQTFEPSWCHFVVREETECCCEYISFPSVLFSLCVACISCRNVTLKFVVAFCLQQGLDVAFLCFAQFIPLEVSRICNRHCPKRTFPNVVAVAYRTPIIVS